MSGESSDLEAAGIAEAFDLFLPRHGFAVRRSGSERTGLFAS